MVIWHAPMADSIPRAVFLSVKEGSPLGRTLLASSYGIISRMQWDPVGTFKAMMVVFVGLVEVGIQLVKSLNVRV